MNASPSGPLHVALSTDRSYLPWCATAVLSCLRAHPHRQVVVHLQHGVDVSQDDLDRLRRMVRAEGGVLDPLPVREADLGPLPPGVAAHGGAVSCARVLLPQLLPDVERLVYLDADTLTVDALDGIVDWPLDGAPVAAVRNVVEPAMRDRLRRLGVPDPMRYLNSGVLVMDLDRMRAQQATERLLDVIRRRGAELLWVDQDALNLALDAWVELPPRYNAQNSFWDWPGWAAEVFPAEDLLVARTDPAVLHFEGPSLCKPWHYLCAHPFVGRHREVLAATPWAGTPVVDRTPATRVIRWLPERSRRAAFVRLLRLRARVRRR